MNILCFSGGIDSLVAWFFLKKPGTIFFKMKHRYQEKELSSVKKLQQAIPELKTIISDAFDFSTIEKDDAYILNRNLFLATFAMNYGNNIFVVGIKGDNVGDNCPRAMEYMTDCINAIKPTNYDSVKVDSPFWDKTKGQIVTWFLQHVTEAEKLLKLTTGCYSETPFHCGECPACFRRWVALKYAGIAADSWFDVIPGRTKTAKSYFKKMSDPNTHYDIGRVRETLLVLEPYM